MQGNGVRARCVFKDIEGDLLDPDPVTVKLRAPDGTESAYVFDVDPELVRDSEGVYLFWFAAEQSDEYAVRFTGVDGNGNTIADEEVIEVEESNFDNP